MAEHFPLCFRVNPYYFALAHEVNGAAKLATFHSHDETYRSILRNQGRGFQQQAADADILTHRLEFNHQVRIVNREAGPDIEV